MSTGNFSWLHYKPPEKLNTPFELKTNDILWFVSNCVSDMTGRMEFAQKLQNATKLKIDIYGKCGEEIGDRNIEINAYKFYLAFENSFCKGYVTEKFFKTLNAGSIPIVRGAPVR